MKYNTLPVLALLLTCSVPATAASLFVETFSNDGNTEGWSDFSNSPTPGGVAQVAATDVLGFNSPSSLGLGYTDYYIIAGAATSGGAFVGDYGAAGVYGFTFDLSITSIDPLAQDLFLELSNFTEDETWTYALALPATGVLSSFFVQIADDTGWVQQSGDQNFSFLLSQTEEIAIKFSAASGGGIDGTLDNFAAVPEPTSIALLGLAGLAMVSRRRRSA